MALVRYLPSLSHFYYGTGSGGLTDVVGSANWTEQGTVGLNSSDGPPPEPQGTSRGPCDSTITGFQRSPSSDNWDLRTTGTTAFTFFCWYRMDSQTTDQELFASWTTTGSQQAELLRYESAFDKIVTHAKGASANHDAGVGPTIETGVWNMAGVSMGGGVHKVFSNGFVDTKTGFGNTYAATSLATTRLGHTVTSVSGSGLKGDIAYINNFNYAFDDADWSYFWNNGNGRLYPNGYTRFVASPIYILAAGRRR